MKFVRLRGAYCDAKPNPDTMKGFDVAFNPSIVESVGLHDYPCINTTVPSDRLFYCKMTRDEVVAAFAEAGVEL